MKRILLFLALMATAGAQQAFPPGSNSSSGSSPVGPTGKLNAAGNPTTGFEASAVTGATASTYADNSSAVLPITSSTVTSGTAAFTVYPWGQYAVVSDGSNSAVYFFDLSRVAAPSLAATFSRGANALGAFPLGKYLYSPEGTHVLIYDISNPSSITTVGDISLGTNAFTVLVDDNILYIGADQTYLYDVTNPALPVLLGTAMTGETNFTQGTLVLNKPYLYVGVDADMTNLVYIVNVSDPRNPVVTGGIPYASGGLPGTADTQGGRYIYVGDQNDEVGCPGTPAKCNLRVYDLADPTAPVLVTGIAVGGTVETVRTSGSYVYVCSNTLNLVKVWNISNPAALVSTTSSAAGLSTQTCGIDFFGKYLLLAGNRFGVASQFAILELPGFVVPSVTAGSVQAEQISAKEIRTNGPLSSDTGVSAGPMGVGSQGPVSGSAYRAPNCADSAGAAACSKSPTGAFVVDAASTATVVSTTAVTAKSRIFVQEDSSLATELGITCNTQSSLTLGAGRVTARTAGTSFTFTLEAGPTTNPACFSYWIIN